MANVSVIIPTYNRASLLPRAVESARSAGTDLEIIVVDDASTDNTPKVCRDLEGIRYVRLNRNCGLAAARNAGIRESSAEYISFLDDDDLRLPGTLDLQIEALEREPQAAFVYGKVFNGDNENCNPVGELWSGECPSGDIFWMLLEKNFIPVLAVVARRGCLKDVGLFNPSLRNLEDWDLWIRLAERFNVVAVQEPVAIYRVWNWSSGQISSNQSRACRVWSRVQKQALRLPRAKAASKQRRKQARRRFLNNLSDILVWGAEDALKHGANGQARMNLLTAIRLNALRTMRPWTLKLLVQSFNHRPNNKSELLSTLRERG